MDILDTRDLNKRLNELEDELEGLVDSLTEAESRPRPRTMAPKDREEYVNNVIDAIEVLKEWVDEYKEELNELYAVQDKIPGWLSGVKLIAEEDFVEYAEQLADDLYGIKNHWPFNHIDWDAAADDLKHDYLSIDYQGTTYFYKGS